LANASCKWLLQMLTYKCLLVNARCKCKLQMQAANAFLKMLAANASCIYRLHMQAANACLQMFVANASLQMLPCKCKNKLQMQAVNFR
ncbi:hypothetical protein Tco_1278962, partial [Tanacetum coccineum]